MKSLGGVFLSILLVFGGVGFSALAQKTPKNKLVRSAASLAPQQPAAASAESPTITLDPSASRHPFPHFWEQMFGSGRAVLSMREAYLRDLREVKQATDFKYVRFHAIFHDEIGIYDEDTSGHPIYNFTYLDQIYDGLLERGVRPYVELSFMPRKLSVDPPTVHVFWYHPLVSPPKDWDRWSDLISHFTRHLIDRYGIDEVSQWYFEVWNEPNLDFWAGDPKETTYYHLYDVTARSIKSVSPRLRVGGPSTAQAAWVDRFIAHCVEQKIPVDFVSTHVYANDTSEDVFGTHEKISRTEMLPRVFRKVHDEVAASARPDLPIFWSEFNATYKQETNVTDSIYMGPWLADMIRQCDGLTTMVSYWTFSDVFEEQGVAKEPFYGGFGLIAPYGLPKPSYNAFKLLHQLGNQRIALDADSALFTRRTDGTLVLAVWNMSPAEEPGEAKKITLAIKGAPARRRVSIQRLDAKHGNIIATYNAMGRPINPTRDEIAQLRKAAQLAAPETAYFEKGRLTLTLPPHALALLEFK